MKRFSISIWFKASTPRGCTSWCSALPGQGLGWRVIHKLKDQLYPEWSTRALRAWMAIVHAPQASRLAPAGTGIGEASTSLLHGDPARTAMIHSPRALLRSLNHSPIIWAIFYCLIVLQCFLKVYWTKCMHFGLERRRQRNHNAGLVIKFAHGFFLPLNLTLYHFATVLWCQPFFLHNGQLTSALCKVSPNSETQ